MDEQVLVEVSAVAKRLGTSPWTVRRLANDGVLPAIRLTPRGRLRFDPADVDELLQRSRRKPVAA